MGECRPGGCLPARRGVQFGTETHRRCRVTFPFDPSPWFGLPPGTLAPVVAYPRGYYPTAGQQRKGGAS
jgi:hypothetical protein